jgi:hypothetical protein
MAPTVYCAVALVASATTSAVARITLRVIPSLLHLTLSITVPLVPLSLRRDRRSTKIAACEQTTEA